MPPKTKKLLDTKNKLQKLFEVGKLPPQAVDLEEAVLGALMLDSDALSNVIDILVPESFYKEAHQIIYKAILDLFKLGEPVDILTVTKQILKDGKQTLDLIGGAYYISTLTNRVASGANAEVHARIIAQKYMSRQLIKMSTGIIENSYEDRRDVFDQIGDAQTALNDIMSENIKSQGVDAAAAFGEFVHHLERASQNKEEITGIPTTLTELDRITNGSQNSDLIIIAGLPGSGKTAATKVFINGAVQKGVPVGIFSLEMSTLQLMARLISEKVEVSAQDLLRGKFLSSTNFNSINSAITHYFSDGTKSLLYIDDNAPLNVIDFRAKAKRMKTKYGVGLIIIDYLQLMNGTNKDGNRVNEISEITRTLKLVAKELNIPIVALSQLNREVMRRGGDFRPRLSDLRDSGSVEQDSDLVMFLYRPWYFVEQGVESMREIQYNGQMISTENFVEIIIAKHRNGALGIVPAHFEGRLTMFKDWNDGTYRNDSPNPPVQPPDKGPDKPIQPNTDFFKEKNDIEEEPPF